MRRGTAVVGLIGAFALAGCYNPNPSEGAPCTTSEQCPGEQMCSGGVCVVDPSLTPLDGSPDQSTIDADPLLDAGPDAACSVTCGSVSVLNSSCGPPQACANGCIDDAADNADRCSTLVLSNGLTPAVLVDGIQAVTLAVPTLFHTATGVITQGGVVLRPGGTGVINGIAFQIVGGVGVFSFDNLVISVSARAVGSRPLGLFSRHDIDITGRLDVGAGVCTDATTSPRCPGPGGGAGGVQSDMPAAMGCAPGGVGGSINNPGGGGGGFGGPGAPGGLATASGAAGGTGGTVIAACAGPSLDPIGGGSGGGAGGDLNGGLGGGGGGAVHVAALGAITISISGVITAGGGRGSDPADNFGGGGGGSGGAILLEAGTVLVHGIVAANGGGGAAGDSIQAQAEDGQASAAAARGGTTVGGNNGSNGGSGGALGVAAQPGLTALRYTGGGGGGVGRIAIHAGATDVQGTISPAASLVP